MNIHFELMTTNFQYIIIKVKFNLKIKKSK
jgi:hypothetical protein